MRIVIVAEVYLPKIDGVVVRTLNLIRELQANGDEVLVVCSETAQNQPRHSPVPCLEFPGFEFPMYPEYRIGLPDKKRLPAAIRNFNPDVVHFLNPFAFGFQCYDRMQRAGLDLPTVFSFHTLYGEFVKRYGPLASFSRVLWWLTQKYHNQADMNLTVSSIMREDLEQRGFERVRLWQPAVDAKLFHPNRRSDEMRRRLLGDDGSRNNNRLLLTVSRLAPEKNVEFLADVLKQLPDTTLAIVGDGPHRPALEEHFSGLPSNFIGYLQGEELASAYASSDAFLYASETETMGNVILESMASGLPVVAPRAGGIPSLLTERESGYLFEPGEIEAAALWTDRLLTDVDHREQMSQSARRETEDRDWKHAALRVRGDYQEAIATHRTMPKTRALPRATTRALVMGFRAASRMTRRRRLRSAKP